jgi:hypothetical protein
MNQPNAVPTQVPQPQVPVALAQSKKRLPAPILLGRLKAERIEQPLAAAKVLEAMNGLPGWGLSPKAFHLYRVFHFPGGAEAQAFADYLQHMGRRLKVQMVVTIEKERVYLKVRGKNGGVPEYLLDFAALLSQ